MISLLSKDFAAGHKKAFLGSRADNHHYFQIVNYSLLMREILHLNKMVITICNFYFSLWSCIPAIIRLCLTVSLFRSGYELNCDISHKEHLQQKYFILTVDLLKWQIKVFVGFCGLRWLCPSILDINPVSSNISHKLHTTLRIKLSSVVCCIYNLLWGYGTWED